MLFEHFAQWVHGMDAMVDVFAATAERRFAMITRSAVALRLEAKQRGAADASARRFAPEASLERAASSLAKAVPLP